MISVTPSPRRIASHYLLTRSGLRPRPLLTLADDGTVVGVDTWRDPDRQAGVEFYSGILLPGMVNAHCHLELSCLRGAIPAGGGFAAFARGMGAQRGRFDEEQRRRAIEGGRRPHVARGRGGRGRRGQWREYVRCEGAQRDPLPHVRRTFRLAVHVDGPVDGLLRHAATSLTPHSTYSVPDALFRRICSGGDAPLSIHFMESPAEEALYRGEGELAAWYAERGWRCDFLHYGLAGRTARRERPAHAQRAARPQLLCDAADDRPRDGALHGTRVVVPLPGFEPVYLGIAPAGGAAAGERVEYLCGNRFAGVERRVVARRRTASAGRRGSAGRTPAVGDGGRCGGVGFRR